MCFRIALWWGTACPRLFNIVSCALRAARNGTKVGSPFLLSRTFLIPVAGTAFTAEERNRLKLRGLLPPTYETLEEQASRALQQFNDYTKPIEKYVYLDSLRARNQTLFYKLLCENLELMMPIVYTPTGTVFGFLLVLPALSLPVGEACIKFGHHYRIAQGMYLSKSDEGEMAEVLANWPSDVCNETALDHIQLFCRLWTSSS